MKAVHATAFGDPDVLALVDLPDPEPGANEVAIDVSHAAVGLIDVLFRQGMFKDHAGLPQPPFIPGLEVAGTVRACGARVTRFAVGERVVAFAGNGTGGYASIAVRDQDKVFSLAGHAIESARAVAVIPNAAMAFVALTRVARLAPGERVLVLGALGGFAAAFPGIARKLGAARVVGSVRAGKLAAAAASKLPYDRIVDAAALPAVLHGETFDVIVDPVGGAVRTHSLDLLAPFGRLLVVGNASNDWTHGVDSNRLWLACATVSGFNAGAYLPAHPDALPAAVEAALAAAADGLLDSELEVLPLADAARAHERMQRGGLSGRIVLSAATGRRTAA